MTNQTLTSGKNDIQFKSQGNTIAAHLYLPEGLDERASYPAVLFAGPFNQIKEQTGAVYGRKLAAIGYAALVFDHAGYGESEGAIRNFEHPFMKMETIRDAVSFLGTLSFVDRSSLFGLGLCAGGGYMPIIASTDKRLRAVATVSGMMDNMGNYFGLMTREQIVPLLERANAGRQAAYETGEVTYYDALAVEDTDPSTLEPGSAVAEGYDYYMTERAGAQTYPGYTHLAPQQLLENIPLSSAQVIAPYLYTPYLGIYGERAMQDTGPMTVAFHEAASEPKELFEVPGASHVSLYDIDEDVDRAVARMDEFFKKHSA